MEVILKKVILVLLSYFLLFLAPNAFAEEEYRYLDLDIPLKVEVVQIYDNYMQELYDATNKAFKNYKFNNFGMKFGFWDASVSCLINKDGIIEKFFLQYGEVAKQYTLIHGEYLETDDRSTASEYYFNAYFNSDLLPHPIRKKAYFKYRFEYFDHIKNFIINDMPVIPFPEGIQHDKLRVRMHLYYVPFDPVRYYYGKLSLRDEHLYSSGRGDPKHNIPPAWTFDILRN